MLPVLVRDFPSQHSAKNCSVTSLRGSRPRNTFIRREKAAAPVVDAGAAFDSGRGRSLFPEAAPPVAADDVPVAAGNAAPFDICLLNSKTRGSRCC